MLLAISHAPRRIPTLTTLNLLYSYVSALQVYIFQGQIWTVYMSFSLSQCLPFYFAFLSLPSPPSVVQLDLCFNSCCFLYLVIQK